MNHTCPRATSPRSIVQALTYVTVAILVAGCTYRATPVDPRSVGGLKLDIEDPDAGLVGVEPGFNLKQYQIIVVERFLVAPSEIKDEADTRLAKEMSAYLCTQLVSRMKADPFLPKVIDASVTTEPPTGPGILALQGDISRLTEGSQALRYFAGFGAGTAKAQVETRLVDTQSQEVQMITADRRTASGGLFGGDSLQFLKEFLDGIAKSYAEFLHRLATGGQVGRR